MDTINASVVRKNIIYLALILLLSSFTNQFSFAASENATFKPITVDTPLMELIKNDEAKAVVSKYLATLVERFENDWEVQDFFYDATLRELSVDDNHVIGFTEEMLKKIEAELLLLAGKNELI